MVLFDVRMPKSCSDCDIEYFDRSTSKHRCPLLLDVDTNFRNDRELTRRFNCPIRGETCAYQKSFT